MECRIAQELIIEALDSAALAERQELDAHLAGCPDCARFAARQAAVEARLRSVLVAPELSPRFRTVLREQIRSDAMRLWADSLPDKVHFASCGAATVACAIFLPFSAPMVLGIGAAGTLATYLLLSVIRSGFEAGEEAGQ